LILTGKVEINGKVVSSLPIFVIPGEDRIVVNGRSLSLARPRQGKNVRRDGPVLAGPARLMYILVNKPERVMTAIRDYDAIAADAPERSTVMDLVRHPAITAESEGPALRVFPVGRLDFHATGLVLLTNDGDLAHRLTHPSFGTLRTYRLWVRGQIDAKIVEELRVTLDRAQRRAAQRKRVNASDVPAVEVELIEQQRGGIIAQGSDAFDADDRAQQAEAPSRAAGSRGSDQGRSGPRRVDPRRLVGATNRATPGRVGGAKSVLDVTLVDPKLAELELMLQRCGCRVVKMSQVALGPLKLSEVALGDWRELRPGEIGALRRSVGLDGRPPARRRAEERERLTAERRARLADQTGTDGDGPGKTPTETDPDTDTDADNTAPVNFAGDDDFGDEALDDD
jgi:pseudouridine synthase